MVKAFIKRAAYRLTGRWARHVDESLWLRRKAKELLRRSVSCATPSDYLSAVDEVRAFAPWQKRTEMIGLLEVIKGFRPRLVCEIGSACGGTLFLIARMSHAQARIFSIDIGYTWTQRNVFPRFAGKGQTVSCIKADSQALSTRRRLEALLHGQKLDFLFIDGDHSYAGIASDFALYSPLVRPGGIIALHDIVADFRGRYGIVTTSESGGVPRFWSETKKQHQYDYRELIDDPNQDGFGIGVLCWSSGSD